jgi:hypothetical protein
LSEIASFGLARPQAVAIAQAMQRRVEASWEILAKKTGLTLAEVERLRTCFIACDEKIDREDRE